jgi:hypothetical protein
MRCTVDANLVRMVDLAEDDGPFLDALAAVTDAQWDELWNAVDALDRSTSFAEWAGGDIVDTRVIDGVEKPVTHVPYPRYTPEVERLRSAIGGCGLVVPYAWMDWDGLERYRDGVGLADAPVADAVRMITAIVRSERFGDGNLEGALQSGTLQAAIARLRAEHG